MTETSYKCNNWLCNLLKHFSCIQLGYHTDKCSKVRFNKIRELQKSITQDKNR